MCIDFDKKWIGLDFSQTHPVTLVGGPALNVFTKAANGCVHLQKISLRFFVRSLSQFNGSLFPAGCVSE
jgi:hypothetical protein